MNGFPTPEEMMRMADQAYAHSRFEGARSFTDVPVGGEVWVKGRKFFLLDKVENPGTGLDAYLVTDENHSFMVVAYRGTDDWGRLRGSLKNRDILGALGSGPYPDVGADIEYFLGRVPGQARQASEVFGRWWGTYGEMVGRWGVTGHSLGGIDVQYVMARYGDLVDWGYNFSGPNLYGLLSDEEREVLGDNGCKLWHLGGQKDWIFNWVGWKDYVGLLGFMDMDPGNHDIGPQFRFDQDGNPVLLAVKDSEDF